VQTTTGEDRSDRRRVVERVHDVVDAFAVDSLVRYTTPSRFAV
jgi:hypothetical protein